MRRLPSIPTPLEGVDTVADMANQAVSVIPRVVGNVAGAISQAAKNVQADLARPRDVSEIPPPPDTLAQAAIDTVGHTVGGVMDAAKGVFDGVVDTVEGVKREADHLVRR